MSIFLKKSILRSRDASYFYRKLTAEIKYKKLVSSKPFLLKSLKLKMIKILKRLRQKKTKFSKQRLN